MTGQRLLGLHGVRYRTRERREVGPIHLEICRGDRILLRCGLDADYDGLLDLLTGQVLPIGGFMDEMRPVVVQTDRRLRELLNPNRTFHELLSAGDLPDYLWLEQRRRSLFVVLGRLGLSPETFHRPLKMEGEEVLDKVWALRFVASRADLLIGREIFRLRDEAVWRVMLQRWDDFPGALLYAGPPERIPGRPTITLTVEDSGAVRVEPNATAQGGDDSIG